MTRINKNIFIIYYYKNIIYLIYSNYIFNLPKIRAMNYTYNILYLFIFSTTLTSFDNK